MKAGFPLLKLSTLFCLLGLIMFLPLCGCQSGTSISNPFAKKPQPHDTRTPSEIDNVQLTAPPEKYSKLETNNQKSNDKTLAQKGKYEQYAVNENSTPQKIAMNSTSSSNSLTSSSKSNIPGRTNPLPASSAVPGFNSPAAATNPLNSKQGYSVNPAVNNPALNGINNVNNNYNKTALPTSTYPAPSYPASAAPNYPTSATPAAGSTYPASTYPTSAAPAAGSTYPAPTYPTTAAPAAGSTYPAPNYPTSAAPAAGSTYPASTYPTSAAPAAGSTYPASTYPTSAAPAAGSTYPAPTYPTTAPAAGSNVNGATSGTAFAPGSIGGF